RVPREARDRGVQPATGDDQQREAGPDLLIVDADVTFLIQWHDSLSLHSVSSADARTATSHASRWSRRTIIAQRRLARAGETGGDGIVAPGPRAHNPEHRSFFAPCCLSLRHTCRICGHPTFPLLVDYAHSRL